MLRRRILASTMASVMALTSVAVVANADETATTQVKTKADLEALVKSYESFREKDYENYGSISGENFLNALEYADNVLEDTGATVDNYTVAYKMIETLSSKLVIRTASELKTLIDTCKSTYETDNIYNEDLGDLRYDPDTYADFEDAYNNATSISDSADSRIITDAYEELADAKAKLSALDTVTKSQFRTALKNYESALQKEYAYDAWRVGTIDTGWAYWGYQDQTVAYGTLYEHVASLESIINAAYDELDAVKGLTKTSQVNIVEAYKACTAATTILNGFTPDDTNRSSKAGVQNLLNEYHSRLVYSYTSDAATNLYNAVVNKLGKDKVTVVQANNDYSTTVVKASEVTTPWYVDTAKFTVNPNGDRYSSVGDVVKIVSAEITVKSTDSAFYIPLDDDGYWNGKAIETTKPTSGSYKMVSKNASVNLADYIAVSAADITSETDNHLNNNVIDGDFYQYDVDIEVTDLANYKSYVSESWMYDQFVEAIAAKGYYDTAAEEATDSISDYFAELDAIVPQLVDDDGNGVSDGEFTSDDIGANWALVGNYAWGEQLFIMYYANGTGTKTLDSLGYQIGQWGAITPDAGIITADAGFEAYQHMNGTYKNSSGDEVATYADLGTAVTIAEQYLDKTYTGIYAIDTIGQIAADSAKGSATEWSLVYRYLKYALSDKYDVTYGTYTKSDVNSLIEKAYELAETTGDAALFEENHTALVKARQDALAWVKAANKVKGYKDNVTSAEVSGTTTINGDLVATEVYEKLYVYYKALEDQLADYKYSYGEIYNKIADVADQIDSGDLQATDALITAINDTVYNLAVLQATDEGDNDVFTSDRQFISYNRLFTDGDNQNDYEEALQTSYEALLAEIKAQTETTALVGDVNGDGVVNSLDASAILKAVVDGTTIETAVGDYNADGAVNALDASAILKAVIAG